MTPDDATRRGSHLVDLAHTIDPDRPWNPHLPTPRVEAWRSHLASRPDYGGLAEFEISRLFFVGNTGTSIDSPRHRYPAAADVADLPAWRLVGPPGRRVDARPSGPPGAIGPEQLPDDLAGAAVLLWTGWDRRIRTTSYWRHAPYLGRTAAERLVAAGAAIVGIDAPNVDDIGDPSRPAHTVLLGAGIPILEHLRGLEALPPAGFHLYVLPAPFHGATAMPVRVVAEVHRDGPDRAGSF